VGLFKPYGARPDASAQTPTATDTSSTRGPAKKTIATPSRKQAEADRRNRIQPVLTRKESKAAERDARFKARDEASAKMNAVPSNALIRDWVDRRINVAEFALPLMLLVFVVTIAGTYFWPGFMLVVSYAIWGIFALLILDVTWMWMGLRRQLGIFFPHESRKGKLGYALSRVMLMRRSRVPAPRVKRGEKFQWPNPADSR
jgi:hypothetical protein